MQWRTVGTRFKRIVMRADKSEQSFNAIINLTEAVINSK